MKDRDERLDRKKVCAELERRAKKQRLVTYKELALLLGLRVKDCPPTFYYINELLEQITEDRKTGGRPMLCAVAVGTTMKGAGVPGDGFYKLAFRLGYALTPKPDLEFWIGERDATYDLWRTLA